MAQKPLKDMSYKGYENHSEEFGFMREDWLAHVRVTDSKLDQYPTSKDMAEQIGHIVTMIENCVSKEDWAHTLMDLTDNRVCAKDFYQCINTLSAKLDAHTDAIRALADKLDAEDVTNLDTDYRATVDAEIK